MQNLRNRMEAQIKRIEAQIEKTQQIFHKDLEEIINRQSAVNNTITEIKNALEKTNSRITQAEEWINRNVCQKMEWWKKLKENRIQKKRNEMECGQSQRPLGQH